MTFSREVRSGLRGVSEEQIAGERDVWLRADIHAGGDVSVRISEIAKLTNTIPQVLQKIERRAMEKLLIAIKVATLDFEDDRRPRVMKRRRVVS